MDSEKGSDPEIRNIIKEEVSRGRKPIDTDYLEKRKRTLRCIERLKEERSDERFREFLDSLDLPDDEYEEYWVVWRSCLKPKHRRS